MEGWIKLHRQICDSEFYFAERFTKALAWVDLLLLAAHKPNTFYIRSNEVNVQSGEVGYSELKLTERWQWDRKTVHKFLLLLKKRGMVDIRSSRLTTVITIRNWDKYQGGGQQKGQQKDNRTDTIKNDKKVEKLIALSTVLIAAVKSESSLDSIIEKYKAELGVDRLREILAGCVKRNLNFDDENRLAAYLQTCLRQNGHSKVTSGLKDLKGDEIGYI